jgi:hypothetical protein
VNLAAGFEELKVRQALADRQRHTVMSVILEAQNSRTV